MMRRGTALGAALGVGAALAAAGCSANTAPQPQTVKEPAVCKEVATQPTIASETQLDTYLRGIGSCIIALEQVKVGADIQSTSGYNVATILPTTPQESITMVDYTPSAKVPINWSIVEMEPTKGYIDPVAITAAFYGKDDWSGTLQTNNFNNTTNLAGYSGPTPEDTQALDADWAHFQQTTDKILTPTIDTILQDAATVAASSVAGYQE